MAITLTQQQAKPVLDAMREISTEGDLWFLAETLRDAIPKGEAGFRDLMDKAISEGVAGRQSAQTLRHYRDTAIHWPRNKRVAGVSFSAHRDAYHRLKDVDKAAALLNQLAKQPDAKGRKGPDRVTVERVRQRVAAQKGVAPAPSSTRSSRSQQTAAPQQPPIDMLADLKAGGPKIIGQIPSGTLRGDLDKLQRGMNKVLAHVERLIAKANAAKRPASANGNAAPATPISPSSPRAVKKTAGAQKRKGDLRGVN